MKNHANLPDSKLFKQDYFWQILLLFGSFCIGFNISIAFHELGHAFAVILDGGTIQEFVLNPFSWSWNLGENVNNPIFTAWGGITFGLLFAIIPAIFIIWVKSLSFRVPILATAGCAFLINGIYLLMGILFNIGDGGELIHYGVSPVVIFLLGCIYFLTAIFIWIIIQPLLGINSSTLFIKRLLILISGISPYLLMIFLYNLSFNKRQLLLWSSFALVGIITVFIFSVAGHFWSKFDIKLNKAHHEKAAHRPVIIVNIIALSIIIGELLLFGMRDNPF